MYEPPMALSSAGKLTRMGALLRRQEKGANLTSTFSLPFSLYVVFLDCRGPYLQICQDQQRRTTKDGTNTAQAIFVRSVSIYAEPFA